MGQRIAILGAGPMGLAAAWYLARRGHHPVLFEADSRIGGMTATFDFDGVMIERYYHFHCTSDTDFLFLLDELGLLDKMHWTETKMGYWFQGKVQSWGSPLALLKFKGISILAKIRYGLHSFLCVKRRDWQPLDSIEAIGWIKKWVGKEAYEALWHRLFDYKFHQYANNLSAAWIWSRIRRIGRSRYNLFREKLGYLEGGSQTLLQALASGIESHGGIIRLNAPVSKVIIEDDRVQGLIVNGQIERFDKVISTIPLPYIPEIIPDLPSPILTQFKSINNIAVVCVIAKLNKSLTENFWLNINDPDMDIPGLLEYSNLRYLHQITIIYVPFYMPADNPKYAESDQIFQAKVQSYLKKINPNLSDNNFISMHVSRYRYAQPICPPGYRNNLPPAALPVSGLWVADTSYYYPEDRGISESIGFGRYLAKEAARQ